jgi:hypothetical protein
MLGVRPGDCEEHVVAWLLPIINKPRVGSGRRGVYYSIMKKNNYLLTGWIALLLFVFISLYFYLFHPEAMLYYVATMPSSIGNGFNIVLPEQFELYEKIIPYKKPVFFAQFALTLLLCAYTKAMYRRFDLIIIRVIYWLLILLIICYSLLTLVMPIIPYGGMVG